MPDTALPDAPDALLSDGSLCGEAAIWRELTEAALEAEEREPMLRPVLERAVCRHRSFAEALAGLLADKLASPLLRTDPLARLIAETYAEDACIVGAAVADIQAAVDRNPAFPDALTAFLFGKGFHALESYRVAHRLWLDGRRTIAMYLAAQANEVFAVDIHPAARIGEGVFIDHATGVVVGETASIGSDTSILQGVTLGGTGKDAGDRHPKVGRGVLIGAGATLLGNIEIGDGAKIGAGSVVLNPVEPQTTVVGVPAKTVSRHTDACPARSMCHVGLGFDGDGI